jgi:hypothetical protein
MKNLLLQNYTIFWNSIVLFQYKAIGTGASFNMEVYIHSTVEGEVLAMMTMLLGPCCYAIYIPCLLRQLALQVYLTQLPWILLVKAGEQKYYY